MTTKFKIIIAIFSIITFIFIIQSMANAIFPEGKVENFEEDENEKPLKTKSEPLKKVNENTETKKVILSDQAIRMKVLEVIEEVFNEKDEYKKNASTNKPVIFDIIISDPTNIEKLKNSSDIKTDIKVLIDKNMKNINSDPIVEEKTSEKYQDEKPTTTTDNTTYLNDIENKVQKIVDEGNSILEKIKNELNSSSIPNKNIKENFELENKLSKKLPNVIEGFESIRTYATF